MLDFNKLTSKQLVGYLVFRRNEKEIDELLKISFDKDFTFSDILYIFKYVEYHGLKTKKDEILAFFAAKFFNGKYTVKELIIVLKKVKNKAVFNKAKICFFKFETEIEDLLQLINFVDDDELVLVCSKRLYNLIILRPQLSEYLGNIIRHCKNDEVLLKCVLLVFKFEYNLENLLNVVRFTKTKHSIFAALLLLDDYNVDSHTLIEILCNCTDEKVIDKTIDVFKKNQDWLITKDDLLQIKKYSNKKINIEKYQQVFGVI